MISSRFLLLKGLALSALLFCSLQTNVVAVVMIADFEVSDHADRKRSTSTSSVDFSEANSEVQGNSSAKGSAPDGGSSSTVSSSLSSDSNVSGAFSPSSSSAGDATSGGAGGPQAGDKPMTSSTPPAPGTFYDSAGANPISLIGLPGEATDLGFGSPTSSLPQLLNVGRTGYSTEEVTAANQGDPEFSVSALDGLTPSAAASAPEAPALIVWGVLGITALVGGLIRTRRLGC
jgi:hypothetical protein